jgi:hypothetical protein
MSKVEGFCFYHKGDITGIEFLSPYPLMLTSSMDARICIWGVRPCPIAQRYICLHSFINKSFQYNKDVDTAITKISKLQKSMMGIRKYTRT